MLRQRGEAGGGTTHDALRKADEAWKRLRATQVNPFSLCDAPPALRPPLAKLKVCMQISGPAPEFVRTSSEPVPGEVLFDVVVAGGTLGIFLACVLQLQGFK